MYFLAKVTNFAKRFSLSLYLSLFRSLIGGRVCVKNKHFSRSNFFSEKLEKSSIFYSLKSLLKKRTVFSIEFCL